MKFRGFGGVAVAIAALAVARDASAAPAIDGGASAIEDTNDVPTLLEILNQESSALSTSDCGVACRALASIRRAADKICALEPGPRCDTARDRATDATKRVREACPDCSLAMGPTPTERAAQPSPTDAPAKANMPAPESERGGCKSCSQSMGADSSVNLDLALIALAILGVARRRKR